MAADLDPENRLGYSGDLAEVVNGVAVEFGLGNLESISHLAEGYEDCNLKLKTAHGTYVCKLFADNQLGDYSKTRRGVDVADRLVDIILAVQANGAHAPELVQCVQGDYLFHRDELVAMVYKWVEGKTYFELDRAPNDTELESVVRQAALINTTSFKPVYYHDIWAVPHIHALFEKVKPILSTEDTRLATRAIRQFDVLKIDELPKCLVHGDMTKGNVLLGKDGKPYIIDFSVTNWTTRIIELVLIISNLMHDQNDRRSLQQKVTAVTTLYQPYNQLTRRELQALYDLCLTGSAMELLGSRWRQEFLDDTSEETAYWLELGRSGLRQAFA